MRLFCRRDGEAPIEAHRLFRRFFSWSPSCLSKLSRSTERSAGRPEQAPAQHEKRCPPQQSASAARARQICERRAAVPSLTRSLRSDLGTVCRLSKLATHSSDRPSSIPSRISVRIARILRVTGATTIQSSTGTASVRVTTSTGRRLSSASPHQTSPCRGVDLTTARRRSSAVPLRRPRPSPSGLGHPCVGIDDLPADLLALELVDDPLEPDADRLERLANTPAATSESTRSASESSSRVTNCAIHTA